MNSVKDQTAVGITATYFKLMELSKVLADEKLVRAIAAQSKIPPEETGALIHAMNHQKKDLQARLQLQVANYATLIREVH